MKAIFWTVRASNGRPLGKVLADSPALAHLLAARIYGEETIDRVTPDGPVPRADSDDDQKVLRWPGGA